MPSPKPLEEDLMNEILRRVLHHVDLFENHIALALHFDRGERWIENDIRKKLEGKRQMLVQNPCIEPYVLLICKCVELSPYGIDRLRNIRGRTGFRAFEEKVLNEVRDARCAISLEPRAAFDPDADRDGSKMRHDLCGNHEAVFHLLLSNIHSIKGTVRVVHVKPPRLEAYLLSQCPRPFNTRRR